MGERGKAPPVCRKTAPPAWKVAAFGEEVKPYFTAALTFRFGVSAFSTSVTASSDSASAFYDAATIADMQKADASLEKAIPVQKKGRAALAEGGAPLSTGIPEATEAPSAATKAEEANRTDGNDPEEAGPEPTPGAAVVQFGVLTAREESPVDDGEGAGVRVGREFLRPDHFAGFKGANAGSPPLRIVRPDAFFTPK